ncbi:MAG: septal ring lytic transglycosylase RlpA family protein [Rhodospirillaceae bacterium]|nr:septal ring lytic transglycosylase RlpA family protein [Rhodospirillaceae bacterium]
MKKSRSMARLAVLALALAAGACSSTRGIPGPTGTPYKAYIVGQPYQINGRWYTPREDFDYDRVGTASWYGSDFHGRRTANGETYDMNAMTAAHTTLPMPTIVRVTNLDNGRSVVVRINDRGPFVSDRIIDMSRAAARELGFEGRGLARVRVTVMREASLRLKRAAGLAERDAPVAPPPPSHLAESRAQ